MNRPTSTQPITLPARAPEAPSSSTSIPVTPEMALPATIDRGITIAGDIIGERDLIVSGRVEGSIHIPDHAVTVSPRAEVLGGIFARTITINGKVTGDVTASNLIDLLERASVLGDLTAPRIALAEGAAFHGRVEMKRADAAVRVARYRMEKKGNASRP